jgi:hypothetical protein
MSHPHMNHDPLSTSDHRTHVRWGDRDRPVVAPRARTRTPDARLHKTYMKPNAECTHGQYSFLFDQIQTYKTAHGRYRIDSCTARVR